MVAMLVTAKTKTVEEIEGCKRVYLRAVLPLRRCCISLFPDPSIRAPLCWRLSED